MTLRSKVFDRDRGVCAECGLDTEAEIEKHIAWYAGATDGDELPRSKAISDLLWEWDWPVTKKSLWEADHNLPRHRGGTDELENIRTLCVGCHSKKTRQVDVPAAAKDRRKRKKHDAHKAKMVEKFSGE